MIMEYLFVYRLLLSNSGLLVEIYILTKIFYGKFEECVKFILLVLFGRTGSFNKRNESILSDIAPST